MNKEQKLNLMKNRLKTLESKSDIKSYGVINKLKREIRNLEK